jgi:galactitol-specific phosphotransferase system IIB component
VKKVKILVVCGTGIATSTVVSRKLEEKLPERGFNVETRQCKAAEVKENLNGALLKRTELVFIVLFRLFLWENPLG